MRAAALLMSLVALLVLGTAVGELDATTRHVGDYQVGWTDGYAARSSADARQDARMVAAGVCGYASLACPKVRK